VERPTDLKIQAKMVRKLKKNITIKARESLTNITET
jgi:hypothetical protein